MYFLLLEEILSARLSVSSGIQGGKMTKHYSVSALAVCVCRHMCVGVRACAHV